MDAIIEVSAQNAVVPHMNRAELSLTFVKRDGRADMMVSPTNIRGGDVGHKHVGTAAQGFMSHEHRN